MREGDILCQYLFQPSQEIVDGAAALARSSAELNATDGPFCPEYAHVFYSFPERSLSEKKSTDVLGARRSLF
jgi:hypothetical protein